MSAPLPPCGCKSGCQHREHPQFPPQRECRVGYVPPAHAIRGRTIPCEITAAHVLHPITDGPYATAMCPGVEERSHKRSEPTPPSDPAGAPMPAPAPSTAEALEEFVKIWTTGMVALSDAVRKVAESAMPAMADLQRALQNLADAGLLQEEPTASELTPEETARGRWDDWRAQRTTDDGGQPDGGQ